MSLEPYFEYFSTFQNLPKSLIDSNNLSNGLLLYDALTSIANFPNTQLNQKPQTFSHKFTNLKKLYECVQTYWKQILNRQLSCEQINFVQIANHQKKQELVKLGELFVKTAVQSSNRQYFIERILRTSIKTQQIFMKIVQVSINHTITDSPRKQKQKRLIDKLIELQHEIDNLQQVLTQVCQQKFQIQNKFKSMLQKISQKDRQIVQLNQKISDMLQTPRNSLKNQHIDENNEKYSELNQKLKNKIIQMTTEHQKSINVYKQQIEFFSNKMGRLEELQHTLEQYKEKISDANRSILLVSTLQSSIRDHLVSIRQQNEQIIQLKSKLQQSKDKIIKLEYQEVQYRLEIQRKNFRIQQLMKSSSFSFKQDNYLSSCLTIHKTLSQQCPQIINNQTDTLKQSNRVLRQQLQRATKTLKINEIQLAKYKSESEKYRLLQEDNKKLTKIVNELSSNRGEQNQILIGCLYELRLKFKGDNIKKRSLTSSISKSVLTSRLIN